jgi:hypothetical protein
MNEVEETAARVLSPKRYAVYEMKRRGYEPAEIAEALQISRRTVRYLAGGPQTAPRGLGIAESTTIRRLTNRPPRTSRAKVSEKTVAALPLLAACR